MNERILFVDRDGTILEEPEDFQVDRFEKMRFVEGVLPALKRLREAGWKLVMVSNQDGLGTKSFPRADFTGPHELMMQILESQGARFDEVLICPHMPGEWRVQDPPQTITDNISLRNLLQRLAVTQINIATGNQRMQRIRRLAHDLLIQRKLKRKEVLR